MYIALSFGSLDKKDTIDNNLIRYDGSKKILERAINKLPNYLVIKTILYLN